jgi:hypothetical protein
MEKNVFLTFCFSLVPGLGQMYQEYIKRGVSLLILTFSLIFASILFGSGLLMIPVPVIMAYSFFDSFKLRNMFRRSEEMPEDNYLFGNNKEFDELVKRKQPIIGFVILFIGLYLLLNNVITDILILNHLERVVEIMKSITRYMPTLIVSVLAMWFGTKLITNKGE